MARAEALKFYSNTTTTSTPPSAIKFRLNLYTAEREIIYFGYLYSSFGSSEHCGMISFLNDQDLIFPPNREKHGSNGITELQRFQCHHHRYVNVSKTNPQTLNSALLYALWKAFPEYETCHHTFAGNQGDKKLSFWVSCGCCL